MIFILLINKIEKIKYLNISLFLIFNLTQITAKIVIYRIHINTHITHTKMSECILEGELLCLDTEYHMVPVNFLLILFS